MISDDVIKIRNGVNASLFSEWFIYLIFTFNVLPYAYMETVISIVYLMFYLVTTKRLTIPKDIMQYLLIPTILIIIGMFGSLGHQLYVVLKDGWYFINPILILIAGYLAMYRVRNIETIFRIFVLGGFLLAMVHLLNILRDPSILFEASVMEIRAEKGAGYFLTLISLSIIFLTRKSNLHIFEGSHKKLLIPIILLVDAASIVMSFSRTLWGSLIILILAGSGMLTRKWLKSLLLIATIIAIFVVLIMIAPNEFQNQDTMAGKILNSLSEISIMDYFTPSDIAIHWRGYESYMALNSYLNGSIFNYILGQGFGTLIDMQVFMLLGDETLEYIPILHNGYLYVLIKTGLIGLLLYLIFLFSFIKVGWRYSRSQEGVLALIGRLIIACTLVLFFTTFVISGMFNKDGLITVMLFLGTLLSYVRIRSDESGKI